MPLFALIYTMFILFSPIAKNEYPLVDSELVPYYKDLHSYLSGKVSNEYMLKYENIRFKVIKEADEEKFLKSLFIDGTDSIFYNNLIGLCIHMSNMIIIRESSLKKESPEYIQEIIDHEVGHCAFRRIHRNSTFTFENKTIPKSVMTPVISKSYGNLKLKELYRKELINSAKFNELDIIEALQAKFINLDKELRELFIHDKEVELDIKEDI